MKSYLYTLLIVNLPLIILALVGYPVLKSDPAFYRHYPGLTNRCFALGQSDSLVDCLTRPHPQINLINFMTYLQPYTYRLILVTLILVLAEYLTIKYILNGKTRE